MADRVLILGASARAAAASARRAGLTPFAVDLFADRDTELLCERVWRCPLDRYPEGLFELAKHAPPMPWMYTGGLENYPDLVGALAKDRELLGHSEAGVRTVRDPYTLFSTLTAYGITTPPVCPAGSPQPSDGDWLAKRFRGSGGHGIARYDYHADETAAGDYIQQFVPGTPISATYLGMPWRVYHVGTSRQLVGEPWLHAPEFGYCGNIGPFDLSESARDELREIGRVVTQHALKLGIYGVDFVLDELGHPQPIEVNPRFPASAELYDFAYGEPVLRWHVGCARSLTQDIDFTWRHFQGFPVKSIVGKAIYYAPGPITFPASGPWDESLAHVTDVWRRPDFADVPHPGTPIEPGQPVLTLLTDGPTADACVARLKARAADLDRLFGFAPPSE